MRSTEAALFIKLFIMAAVAFGFSLKSEAYELSSPFGFYNEDRRADFGVSYDRAYSQNYTGDVYQASANIPIYKKDPLLLEVHELDRTYKGASTLSDHGGSIGYIWTEPRWYYETNVTVNPNALFLPEAAVTFVPHYVRTFWHRDWDFSLGVVGAKYTGLEALTLNPRILSDSETFYYAVSEFATRTYDNLFATDIVIGLHLPKKQKIQADYAFGRTIEDAGIEDNFHAIGGLYQIRIWRNWYLGPSVNFYRGNLRYEDDYALRLDVKL